MSKKRIAVLGGGMGALSCVWEITSVANWDQNFEIDVYCMGWRLGGKCASSRDPDKRWRNEEHGLHVLGGFYHNTFQQLGPLYTEWAPQPGAVPFAQAFFPHQDFSVADLRNGVWHQVRVSLPLTPGAPGVSPAPLDVATVLARMWEWTADALNRIAAGNSVLDWSTDFNLLEVNNIEHAGLLWGPIAAEAMDLSARFRALSHFDGPLHSDVNIERVLKPALEQSRRLQLFSKQLDFIEGADWHGVLSFLAAMSTGILVDQLFVKGFDSINDKEATAWLQWHGADAAGVACPLFQAAYHYAFAYIDGDPNRKSIAAGAGMRGLLRMLFTYQGSIFVHMNGGMGEIVAVPYYQVLRARGVRFHFFHRVTELKQTGGKISEINFSVQATCTAGSDAYEPLLTVPGVAAGGRQCWPVAPLTGQLDNAALLQGVDLESWYGSQCVGTSKTLAVNTPTGFDLCVLAIPPAVQRLVTGPLAQADQRWQDMLNAAATTPTIAAQLWRHDDFNGVPGFSGDGLLTGFILPHSTWADFTFQHAFETDAGTPATLSILCGPYSPPPAGDNLDCNFPARETQRAVNDTDAWLNSSMGVAFPSVKASSGGYDKGPQYDFFVRANTDPVALYVLTPPGSVAQRLRCDQSAFTNLFLAGDWTRNNLDMGAVESAVMSGRLCARSICGQPQVIYGEQDT